jgi:probable F420-dependent oxidoreductase
MRLGAILPLSEGDGPGRMPEWAEVRAFALHAEAAGLDSVWVFDHFFYQPKEGPAEGIHEAWTVLAALAEATERVELGQLVMCASFRNPALLAKMAATADAVSGGRLTLGLGAGWHDPEYHAFGYPTDHRGSRFDEALQVIVPMLRGERVTVDGTYHRAREAQLLPPPARRIPVLVAGNGPRILQLTARYADAWNTAWFGRPDERLRERTDNLARALEAEGRDPATLRMTIGLEIVDPATATPDAGSPNAFTGSVDELARGLDAFDDLGFADAVAVLQPMTERSVDRLAEAQRLRG